MCGDPKTLPLLPGCQTARRSVGSPPHVLAMAGLFIWRMFKRKDTPANSPFEGFNKPVAAGAGAGTPEIGSALPRSGFQPAAQPAAFQPAQQMPASAGSSQPHVTTPYGVPSDFDSATFLRHAKSSFIRMQAAWDKADFNDLREFTTPEVYAELKMQIQERGDVADFTDVVSIDAAIWAVAALTAASGIVVLVRMYETHPPSERLPGPPRPVRPLRR